MPKKQPLIVKIYKAGKELKPIHFRTIHACACFLRSKGVRFANAKLSNIESDRVTMKNDVFVYEIEAEID